uniref:Putative secreted protein n=1 Tax=Anopheles darlingi TaxID=43151 RepID=A0A2M4DC41_ANODA
MENFISSHTSPVLPPVALSLPLLLLLCVADTLRCFDDFDDDEPPAGVEGLVREKKLFIRSNGVGRFSLSFSSFWICS